MMACSERKKKKKKKRKKEKEIVLYAFVACQHLRYDTKYNKF